MMFYLGTKDISTKAVKRRCQLGLLSHMSLQENGITATKIWMGRKIDSTPWISDGKRKHSCHAGGPSNSDDGRYVAISIPNATEQIFRRLCSNLEQRNINVVVFEQIRASGVQQWRCNHKVDPFDMSINHDDALLFLMPLIRRGGTKPKAAKLVAVALLWSDTISILRLRSLKVGVPLYFK